MCISYNNSDDVCTELLPVESLIGSDCPLEEQTKMMNRSHDPITMATNSAVNVKHALLGWMLKNRVVKLAAYRV